MLSVTFKNWIGVTLLVLAILGTDRLPVLAETEADSSNNEADEPGYLFANHRCPVSGDPVDPDSFVAFRDEENKVYGRVYLCCDGCAKKAEENIEKLYRDLYRMDRKTGKPKDVVDLKNPGCAMSGEPIIPGLEFEYNGMLVHFCCPGCGQDFLDVPEEQLAKIVSDLDPYAYKAPEKKKVETEPEAPAPKKEKGPVEDRNLTHLFGNHECPVMGDPVVPESYVEYRDEENKVFGRIYMCCDGCNRQVEKDLENLYKKFYRTDPESGEEKEAVDFKNPNCPMSGEPVVDGLEFEYNGMIVHFCCSGCGQDFLETPDEKLVDFAPDLDAHVYTRPAGSGSSK